MILGEEGSGFLDHREDIRESETRINRLTGLALLCLSQSLTIIKSSVRHVWSLESLWELSNKWNCH